MSIYSGANVNCIIDSVFCFFNFHVTAKKIFPRKLLNMNGNFDLYPGCRLWTCQVLI